MGEDPVVSGDNRPEWRATMPLRLDRKRDGDDIREFHADVVVTIYCSRCPGRRIAEVVRSPEGPVFAPGLEAAAERDTSSSPSVRRQGMTVPVGSVGVLRLEAMPPDHRIALTCPKHLKRGGTAEVSVATLLGEVQAARRFGHRRSLSR